MKNHHRMGGKLDDCWTDPYEVMEKLSKGRYCLKTKEGKVLKKLYNGALLKDHLQPKGSNGMYIFYLSIRNWYIVIHPSAKLTTASPPTAESTTAPPPLIESTSAVLFLKTCVGQKSSTI